MIQPDAPTIERLKYLSSVGRAFNDTYSEQNIETGDGFYLALDNLNKFKDGLDQLILDEPVKKGMNDLIEYLRKKIERRTGYVGK